MGECTPINVTNLVDDGLLPLLAYLTVSHTHPKPRNKPIKTLVARQRQPNTYTCTCVHVSVLHEKYVMNIYMCGSFTSYSILGEALEAVRSVRSLGSCGSSIFSCTCTFCMACIPVSGC